ncbi:hypothetical protein GN956_G24827 [Arapaima gigas]
MCCVGSAGNLGPGRSEKGDVSSVYLDKGARRDVCTTFYTIKHVRSSTWREDPAEAQFQLQKEALGRRFPDLFLSTWGGTSYTLRFCQEANCSHVSENLLSPSLRQVVTNT